jgi:hypothetical protein
MKHVLALLLAVTILAQTLVNVGIGAYYHFNKEYITAKLCENRSKPELKCNGHCYLSKQLKKAEEGENKAHKQMLKEKEEIVSAFATEVSSAYSPSYYTTGIQVASNTQLLPYPSIDILQPPPMAV